MTGAHEARGRAAASGPASAPARSAAAAAEIDALSDPPERGTLSALRIGLIWLAANLVVTTLLTGTLFVPGVPFAEAIGWIVLGTLLGAVVLTLIAVMGVRTGLATMALTRGSFGLRGSIVPAIANVVILMGWSWVQAMLAGISLNALVEQWTGFSNPALFSALCEAIVVGLAIFGHEGIAKIEPFFAVVILLITAFIFATAFTQHSPAEYAAIPADREGYDGITVFDIVFATAISWTVLSADLTRSARTQAGGAVGAGVGYSLSTIITMVLGLTVASFVLLEGGEVLPFDPTMLIGAFGAPVAIAMFLSVMATNTMVMYGMTMSVTHALPRRRPLPFLPTALALGVIAVIGSTWMGLLDQFTAFLSLIGALFIPVFAIMIVDYYFARRRVYRSDILRRSGGRYWFTGGWNVGALIVWLLGAGAYLLFYFVMPTPVGAALPTFAVAFLLYWAWTKVARINEDPRAVSQHLADAVDAERGDAAATA